MKKKNLVFSLLVATPFSRLSPMEIKAGWVSLGDLMDCLREKSGKCVFWFSPGTHTQWPPTFSKKDFRFYSFPRWLGHSNNLLREGVISMSMHTSQASLGSLSEYKSSVPTTIKGIRDKDAIMLWSKRRQRPICTGLWPFTTHTFTGHRWLFYIRYFIEIFSLPDHTV